MRNLSRNSRVRELNWKKLVVKKIITHVEREVKDSRSSRLGTQSPWVFGLNRLFDEVRAELLRDISRSLRVL